MSLDANLDAVDAAIINRALVAATHEMGTKLIRSAHSPIVREAQDCSAAIMNTAGRVVAQAELTPVQLGSIAHTFQPCLERYPLESIEPGDFFINNDPYSGGQHIQDIFLFSPIFLGDRLMGFSASVVHHIDLGGGAPGLNPAAGDVHQEGLIFPPTKYSKARDWDGGPFERMIAANVRMPEATVGDIYAQFAANAIGAKRLSALADRYGADTLTTAMDEMLDYSERRIRSAIAGLPDGVFEAEAVLDGDGLREGRIHIRAQVRIDGSNLGISFNGTDDQVTTNINCPFASTHAAAVAVVKSVLTDPDIPFNDGVDRVVSVSAPYGSILNPKPPAPVRARLLPAGRVFNAVMKALAQVAPERVIAEGFDTTTPVCLSHLGPDGYNIYLEILGGGYGGGKGSDGCDAVDCPLSNCSNIPVESLEMDYPFLRVETYALRPGSGGEGQWRGGLGYERSYRALDDGVRFATYSDRAETRSQGLFGGAEGTPAEMLIRRGQEEIKLGSKLAYEMEKDDVLIVRSGGGGGYGAPEARAATAVDRDTTEGLA
ncbi:MAG: hydantoinase B/oxoprolinase family protein [Pseudomonadota bacterium]